MIDVYLCVGILIWMAINCHLPSRQIEMRLLSFCIILAWLPAAALTGALLVFLYLTRNEHA